MRKTSLKIIPTITDGTNKLVLSGYLAKAQTRTTIVNSIVDLVNKNGFDGIDLTSKVLPLWMAIQHGLRLHPTGFYLLKS